VRRAQKEYFVSFNKFYAVFFIVLSQSVWAHSPAERPSLPYNFYAAPHQVVEHFGKQSGCSGRLRAGAMRSSLGAVNTLAANAVGGELGCYLAVNEHVTFHAALFGTLGAGLNRSNDDRVHGDFFNEKTDGYLMLGEAHLILSFDSFEANLGRQRLDTPHMDSDDLRLVPNLFEAYIAEFHLADNLHAGAGFVRTMSGWENGFDQSHFEGVGDAFGGDGHRSWLAWVSHEGDFAETSLWYYNVADNVQIIYADISHSGNMGNIEYTVAVQADWGEGIGSRNMGVVDAKTWGILSSAHYNDITATFAYNRNHTNNGALPSLGGGAFFTSMEDQTLDSVAGDRAEAMLIGLEYAISDHLTLGSAFGQFNARDKSDYDVEEADIYLSYGWSDTAILDFVYAHVNDKNVAGKDHQLRAILTYNY